LATARNRLAAIGAAGFAALYPAAILYTISALTESLFTALCLAGLLALYRDRVFAASVFFVLAILTRPAIELLAPFLVVWFALVLRRKPLRIAMRDLAVYTAVYVLLFLPWWIYNYKTYNTFVRLNLGSGLVFYSGNNPMNDTGGGISAIDYDAKAFSHIADPVARDEAMMRAALRFIRDNPRRFLELSMMKFERFWRIVPFAPRFRGNLAAIFLTISFVPLAWAAIAGLTLARRRFWYLTPLLGFVLYLMLVHMVTIGSIRYRFPAEPILMVLAAPALRLVLRRLPTLRRLEAP
jgi:4-amino-4-deoxy-L-arabinose transferase-like glycosyltransferase